MRLSIVEVAERKLAERRTAVQAKVAEQDKTVEAVAGYEAMGESLGRQYFPEVAVAEKEASGASMVVRRLVRPAAAAAAVGGAGAVGYGVGKDVGEEEGRRREKMRQLMKDLFGIDISEEQ